jgi:surface carbohydrate biosynthesis protein
MTSDRGIVEPAVLLVDNRVRDLDGAALIASLVRQLGAECHLEPLEAYRGVLAAYRPGLIVFNHLTASHLVEWSKRLADMNVLTAVLPNEGIAYDPDVLNFLAGRHHGAAHIDYMFSWNEPYRRGVLAELDSPSMKVEVTGVPRFDFYFKPWSSVFEQPRQTNGSRPVVLVCTNFVTAHYHELPHGDMDKFFAPWAGRIPLYKDYMAAVAAHWRARNRVSAYLDALVGADKYEIIVRPHPSENPEPYQRWFDGLTVAQRAHVRVDTQSNITSLILTCDIEISCETCTTAMEAWIAGKPTMELIFEQHPLWYREVHARCNVPCDDPAKLVDLVDEQLRQPEQPEKRELRRRHLAEWCATPAGDTSLRIAQTIVDALRAKEPAGWSKLTANDYRRAAKLHALRKLGLPYHFDPLLPLKRTLFGDRYAIKTRAYRKSITPRDVAAAQEKFERLHGARETRLRRSA